MSTARQGPAVNDDAGFWDQAQDFLFDAARYKLRMDVQRNRDEGTIPGRADTQSARGGPAQRNVGQGFSAGGMATLLVGGAVLLGGLWLATND